MRGLAKLRLHRDDIAAEILFLLGADSPSLRRLGCQGLAQLGSPLAVSPLVDLPADRDVWEDATRARFS